MCFSCSGLLVDTFPSGYLVLTHKNITKITHIPKILNIYGCFTTQIHNQHPCFAKEASNRFIFAAVIPEMKFYNDGKQCNIEICSNFNSH